MAVNDIYRIEVYQNIGSELTLNVFHLRETVSVTPPERGADTCIQIAADLYALWADIMSEDWRVTTIKARRVAPSGGIPQTVVFGGAEAIIGTLESEVVPSQAAILMSLYSDTSDRTGRGRQYLPGCAESAQNEGQLTEAAYNVVDTSLTDFYEAEKGPIAGGTGKYRFNIWAAPRVGSGDYDVQTAYMHPNLATQRRRRNFPGFGS